MLGIVAAAAVGAACRGRDATTSPAVAALVVARGSIQRTLLLTGRIEAVDAAPVTVPRTSQFRVAIARLTRDGSLVRAGDVVVELDSSAFLGALEEDRLAVEKASRELAAVRARGEASVLKAEGELEKARTELAKAELDAMVPESLHSRREHEQAALALARADSELANATESLRVARIAADADIDAQEVTLGGSRDRLSEAEMAIELLAIKAPRDGVFVVADHPWEGRKVQQGDSLWIGATIGEIPDLNRQRVVAALSDVDDGLLSVGMSARCTLDAFPDSVVGAHVVELSPVAREAPGSRTRRSFEVLLDLDAVDAVHMRPGMSVRVEVPLAHLDGVVVAPRGALDLAVPPARVRLADGGWREVVVGLCDALACEVVSGLHEGDRLLETRPEHDSRPRSATRAGS